MQFILYFLISSISTSLGAISGIGGGVIIKPLMDAVSGMGSATVGFLSAVTVESMAIVSITKHFLSKEDVRLEPRRGTLLAAGSALGGVAGKALFSWFKDFVRQDQAVISGQNIILFFLTILVAIYYYKKAHIKGLNIQNVFACLSIGLILGLLSAFLGIGGGPINLMVLSFLFSMDAKTASLHSIYIILFSQTTSLGSTFISGTVPNFSWLVLWAMVIGGVIGAFIGRTLNRRLTNEKIDRLFILLLFVILTICIYNVYKVNFL